MLICWEKSGRTIIFFDMSGKGQGDRPLNITKTHFNAQKSRGKPTNEIMCTLQENKSEEMREQKLNFRSDSYRL